MNCAKIAGVLGGELGNRHRGADARHHVFALSVHQVVAEQDFFAGRGVAGEGDARAGVLAHIAEDHRHDVDCRAEVVRNSGGVAVIDGALAVPRTEDRLDRQFKLLERFLREVRADMFAINALEFCRDTASSRQR